MSDKSDHWHVGREHASLGEPRYRFQDKYLQQQYDEGYNSWCGGEDDIVEIKMPKAFQYDNYFGRRRP